MLAVSHSAKVSAAQRRVHRARAALNARTSLDNLVEFNRATDQLYRLRFGGYISEGAPNIAARPQPRITLAYRIATGLFGVFVVALSVFVAAAIPAAFERAAMLPPPFGTLTLWGLAAFVVLGLITGFASLIAAVAQERGCNS